MPIIATQSSGPENMAALEYTLYTTPYPIRVSPKGAEEGGELDPERAQLVFVASNNSRDPVRLRKLTVEIPTGDLAAQLALSLERVESTISLNGWTASRSGERIEFTTTAPYTEIAPGQGLTFQIAEIPVNHEVGAVELRITEGYEGTGQGNLSIITGKFPQDFYLDGFAANVYEIDNGGKVVLTWKRSEGVTTTLLYGGKPPEDVTQLERKEIKDVKQTTTFYLIGKVGDVEIMRSVMVTVLKPDMVVKNLTVEGALKAEGGATVYDDFKVTKGTDREQDRALWIDGKTMDVRSKLRTLTSSSYTDSGKVEVAAELTAKGGAVVREEFKVTKGSDSASNHMFWVDTSNAQFRVETQLLKSSAYSNSGKLEVAGPAKITGDVEVEGTATVEKTITAKQGATVYDDFKVTSGGDRSRDRILHADKDTVDIRNKLRLLTDSVYNDGGKLEIGINATVSGKSVICSNNSIRIYNREYGGHLNCTSKFGGDHNGNGREAYWLLDKYSDAYSGLRITKE
ncbi:hypothetical protein [Nocardiopsis synnemataformans]|uniref:hypothetical protein n=1 Tax=Nocardiopsis synnemataformans TaxID=61305 RepID=UPI003EC05874